MPTMVNNYFTVPLKIRTTIKYSKPTTIIVKDYANHGFGCSSGKWMDGGGG